MKAIELMNELGLLVAQYGDLDVTNFVRHPHGSRDIKDIDKEDLSVEDFVYPLERRVIVLDSTN